MAIVNGDGWAVGNIDDMGEGPGFRKVRRALGVTAFGVNAVVIPAGVQSGRHWHDEQEEVYFVHRGRMEMEFGDGSVQVLEEGGVARVDPSTVRRMRNAGDGDLVYLCFGGKDGYVGRDAHAPEGESRVAPSAPPA
jgi:mannose-6-phosphate isomerase-like protein (cupin superfamily)